MKILTMEQCTPEWYQARLGVVTASRFSDVLTKPQSKKDREAGVIGATAKTYMRQLIAETLTGTPKEEFTSRPTDWGNKHEDEALKNYGFISGIPYKQVGLCLSDSGYYGSSPDALTLDGDRVLGAQEVKCPYDSAKHVKWIEECIVPKEHQAQVDGHLYVTGAKWCDFISYDPRQSYHHRLFFMRTLASDRAKELKALEQALARFILQYHQVLKDTFGYEIKHRVPR